MENTSQEINKILEDAGLPVDTVDEGPEREEYLSHLSLGDWDDKDWLRNLKRLREQYSLVFHKYFAQHHPTLLYEYGEDKVYWEYSEDKGYYTELSVSTVKGLVSRLLEIEDMRDKTTESFIKNCLLRLRGFYQGRAKTLDDFDDNDEWFHAANGWVSLKTLDFKEHNSEMLSLRCSAVSYEPEARCPRYDKFLDEDVEIKPDQVRVIDQFSGLSLTNDISHQKMLTLIGKPGSGKSTLLEVWSRVLGDLATQKRLTDLSGESYRFAGSSMVGKSLCWFDEVEVKRAEMSNVLGTLITGTTINVERKGINGIFKAENALKCVLTANDLPHSSEHGMYRRIIYIKFDHSFYDDGTQETNILEQMAGESSGILNRMIKGLHDLRKMRGFTVIEGHEDLIESYKASSDTIAEFLDTYFEPAGDEAIIETTVLLNTYKDFTNGKSFAILTPQRFGRMMSTQPLSRFTRIAPVRTASARGWSGLKVKKGYSLNESMETIQVSGSDW